MASEEVEGVDPDRIGTGRRLMVSPITGDAYIVTKWVDKGPGSVVAIEKEPAGDNRLFVPLKSRFFEAFLTDQKDVELRGVNNNFNAKTVYSGRPAELRRGYNGESLWGMIQSVWFFDTVKGVVDEIDYRRIDPDARNQGRFITHAMEMLDGYDRYVTFEVDLA